MPRPMISILMPFRNTSSFLRECLESILAQSEDNWELLAVNDHSTDKSEAILEEFSTKDHRIKLYSNEGMGIIPALRTAYAKANGEFITRMDSDDIMLPGKLEVLLSNLKAAGPGHLAAGMVKYFSSRGISNGYARYEKWINGLTKKGVNFQEIYKECVIPSPCWMVFREDLDKSRAFIPNRYPEDYDLTFRFYKNGLKCIPCDKILHKWRDYDTRTSRTSEHYAQQYFLDLKLHYFLKLNHEPNRDLAIWGAGNKGKTIAKVLKSEEITFYWLCDNPNKIGKKIYGVEMLHFEELKHLHNPQSIITVANASAQIMIRDYLKKLEQKTMIDYFFFC